MQVSSSICSCLCLLMYTCQVFFDFFDTLYVQHMEYECCFSLTIPNLFNTLTWSAFSNSSPCLGDAEVKFFPVFFKEEGHIQPVLLQASAKSRPCTLVIMFFSSVILGPIFSIFWKRALVVLTNSRALLGNELLMFL